MVVTLDEFRKTTTQSTPPAGLTPGLVALWHDAHGDWDTAHKVAQDIPDPIGAWIHAYLHRKEGDIDNARYWYRRASKPECAMSLEQEWSDIAQSLIAHP
jgi:hypothetical protein